MKNRLVCAVQNKTKQNNVVVAYQPHQLLLLLFQLELFSRHALELVLHLSIGGELFLAKACKVDNGAQAALEACSIWLVQVL